MASQRIEYLDAVKGFAIFLMVFGHALGWNVTDEPSMIVIDYTKPFAFAVKGILWKMVYSFHMPLFFLISGFLLASIDSGLERRAKRHKLKDQIVKKTFRMLVPYFFTGFIMLLYKGYYGYWFLFAIWEISIISLGMVYLLSYINKRNNIWVDVLFWALLLVVLKFLLPRMPENNIVEFDRGLFSIPAFFAGILIRKYDLFKYFSKKHVLLVCFAFLISFSCAYLPFIDADSKIFYVLYKGMGIYVTPILGSLAVILLFKFGYLKFMEKFMTTIGMVSLEIYIVHLFFVAKIPQIGDWIISRHLAAIIPLQVVYGVVLSIIAIAVSLVVIRIVKRFKIISTLFFGDLRHV